MQKLAVMSVKGLCIYNYVILLLCSSITMKLVIFFFVLRSIKDRIHI